VPSFSSGSEERKESDFHLDAVREEIAIGGQASDLLDSRQNDNLEDAILFVENLGNGQVIYSDRMESSIEYGMDLTPADFNEANGRVAIR